MKKDNTKELLLKQLKKMPVVELACQKANVGRTTYYRWRKNKKFAQEADTAIIEGEILITDMSESQLISMIRDKNFQAVQLWLRHHHPKYSNKLEVTATINESKKIELTAEQKALAKKALSFAALPMPKANGKKYEEEKQKTE